MAPSSLRSSLAGVLLALLAVAIIPSARAPAGGNTIECDGNVFDIEDFPGGAACCGGQIMYPLFQLCCVPSSPVYKFTPADQCCGEALYDPTAYLCCPGDQVLPICPGLGGGVSDPYIYAFGGGGFHFTGAPGKVFNLISDAHLQVNCEFVNISTAKNPSAVYLGSVGVMVGAEPTRIVIAPGRRVFVNDKLVYEGGRLGDSSSSSASNYTADDVVEVSGEDFALAAYPNDRVRLRVAHYELSFAMFSRRNDLAWVSYRKPSVTRAAVLGDEGAAAPSLPHGVIGQTADGKPRRTAVVDGVARKQGEGNIEGQWTDYVVRDGLFGVDFAFNRFLGKSRPVREFVAGAVPDEEAPAMDAAVSPSPQDNGAEGPVSFSTGKRLLQANSVNSEVMRASFVTEEY